MLWKAWLPAILLCAVAPPGWGQFTELAATDDGQDLYFSSPLRIEPATASAPESRIFHAGPKGIELFAERGALAPNNGSSSNSDGVGQAQVTGDGRLVGVTAHNVCPGGGPCPTPVQVEGLLRGSKNVDLGPGELQMSRNGRWAVLIQTVIPTPGSTGAQSITATLIDLQTNQSTPIPQPMANSGMVASNGAVLVTQNGAPGIWLQGQFTPIFLSQLVGIGVAFRAFALSDDAGTLVFDKIPVASPGPSSLVALHLTTGSTTTFYTSVSSAALPNFLGITNDGSRVLYNVRAGQAAGPAFIANTSDGSSIPLPLDPGELATAGTLSGSGNAAYLVTTSGRIVKFSLSAGGASPAVTIVPPSFYATPAGNLFAPGSMKHLQGVLPRSADQLAGHIILDGNIVPVLYAGADDIRVQIPWEQKTGRASLLLNMTTESPFYQNDLIFVLPYALDIERADAGQQTLLGLKLVKGDFSGLVTSQPQPGDLITGYFTGLGPVSGSVQTGMPAPTDSLRPIIGQLTCQFLPSQSPMKTVYAGLAPLMIGLYQVTFQMPADAGKVPVTALQCSVSGPGGGGSFTIFGALTGP